MKPKTSLYNSAIFFFLSIIPAIPLSAQEDVTDTQMKFCISSYKNGFYQKTVDCINEVFPGLSQRRDSILAFKYLGLSYGLLNNISRSKESFIKAFAKDSTLDLDTMEFPPTIALILNQIRLEMKLAHIEKSISSPKPKPEVAKAAPSARQITERKSPVLPIMLLSTAIIAAGGGGYFYSNAYNSYRSYKDNGSDRQTRHYSNFKTALAAGASCSVVSFSLTPFSLYLLLKNDTSAKRAAIEVVNGNPVLSLRF